MKTIRALLSELSARAKKEGLLDRLCRYNPFFYDSIRSLLEKVDRMDYAERLALSARLLKQTVEWSARIRSLPADLPLADRPILEKAHLRGREEAFRNHRVLAIPAATSGSTGIPIRLWRSLRCIAAEQAFWDHMLGPYGINLRTAKVARLWGDDVKHPADRAAPYWACTHGGRRLWFASRHLSLRTVDLYAHMLRRFQPDVVIGYPTSLALVARHLKDPPLSVPIVVASAEVLHPGIRDLIRDAFQGVVIDQYGCAERLFFCASVENERYYFNPAYGRVELQPCDRPAPCGYRYAEVIATSYWNEAMPLVRFRMNDWVLYPESYTAEDLAHVEMGLKPVSRIVGRDGDVLWSPRGEMLIGLDHIPHETQRVLQMQLIQESLTDVRLRVIPDGAFGQADHRQLMARARGAIPPDMQVTIELVEQLECLPSGKVPFVIRRQGVGDPVGQPGRAGLVPTIV